MNSYYVDIAADGYITGCLYSVGATLLMLASACFIKPVRRSVLSFLNMFENT